MCGIAGFTHLNNGDIRREVAQRITASLYHRGPDQQGIFEGSEATLCAVRLKIIDLGGGDQPFASDDADTAIAFNGEIYNHLEIRAELEALGHRFRSHCDTETVLRAFLQWDTDCFSRMRGMFAVALWTESRKRLVLVRDRMGIKPLYYFRHGDDVYFGSELKAILEHPEVPRHLDLEALDSYLSVNYVPGPRHPDGGHPQACRPGISWSGATASTWIEPWWTLPTGGVQPSSLEDAKEELDWLLRDSVREHLVSDVPLGVWASGGLDSSTILHYAAAADAGPLKTFSVSFAGRSFDESQYFREIAQRLWHRSSRVRSEPGSGTAERHRGLRLLLRRAQRRRRSASRLVSLAYEPPARDRRALRRRRRRAVRRLPHLSGRPVCPAVPARTGPLCGG